MDSTLGTILLALVFPIAWGLATAWLFDKWRARQAKNDDGTPSGEGAS